LIPVVGRVDTIVSLWIRLRNYYTHNSTCMHTYRCDGSARGCCGCWSPGVLRRHGGGGALLCTRTCFQFPPRRWRACVVLSKLKHNACKLPHRRRASDTRFTLITYHEQESLRVRKQLLTGGMLSCKVTPSETAPAAVVLTTHML